MEQRSRGRTPLLVLQWQGASSICLLGCVALHPAAGKDGALEQVTALPTPASHVQEPSSQSKLPG